MTAAKRAIPMFDYRLSDAPIRETIQRAMNAVLQSGQLILGDQVQSFEENFAKFLGPNGMAVGVGNGTDALAIALRALRIGSGDEVITVPNTAIPTVSAIRMVGATPVFVDVSDATCLMQVESVEQKITSRTKAIVPVHLFGNAVPMRPLQEIAARNSIYIVEDCAQATGTRHEGRAVGTFGHVACFSFYPTKNLGAYGDGGLCYARDPELALSMRQLRMYGCGTRYDAEQEGVCSRLDELQAAILNVKLRHLNSSLRERQQVARSYNEHLLPSVRRVVPSESTSHTYHLFVIQTDRRAELIEELRREGIGHGIHYPAPVHLMKAYRFLGYKIGDFPIAETLAERIISLPCYPGMTSDMVERVCIVVNRVACASGG
jgi:aminotransferase EvaB